MAKETQKAAAEPKRRAKAVLRPREKTKSLAPVQSVPHTIDPEKLEAWRALPKDQRTALRERETVRLFNNAAQMHRDGKLSEAIETYGKSLLLNPKQSVVYNNMGVAPRSSHKLEATVACYRRLLVLKPNNLGVYSNMGNALRELGRGFGQSSTSGLIGTTFNQSLL